MDSLFAPFGVRIEASNSLVQVAFSAFLLVGIVSFAAPLISTIRVLLSLFVLPGKSVCTPPQSSYMQQELTHPDSSLSSVPAAPGPSSPALPMALARSLPSPSRPRATT